MRDWCLVEIQYLLVTLFVNLGGFRSPCLLILEPVGLLIWGFLGLSVC